MKNRSLPGYQPITGSQTSTTCQKNEKETWVSRDNPHGASCDSPTSCSNMRAVRCAGRMFASWAHIRQCLTWVLEWLQAHHGGTGEQTQKAAPTFCYKILSVYIQRDVNPADIIGAKLSEQAVGQPQRAATPT